MSIIQCGTTTTTALVQTGDTNGNLVIQTGSTPTTAMTVSSSQIVNFANAPTVAGAPLPSGAMTLISTQTASNSANISWTGLSGYNSYVIIFKNIINISSGGGLSLRPGTGSGPTYITSNYYGWGIDGWSGATTVHGVSIAGSNRATISGNNYGVDITGGGASGFIFLEQTNSGYLNIQSSSSSYTSVLESEWYNYQITTINTITAFQLYSGSGNISGTASLYGISS